MASIKRERLTICLDRAAKIQIKTQAINRGLDASDLVMEWIRPHLEAGTAQSANKNQ
jgi:hypothetical protein